MGKQTLAPESSWERPCLLGPSPAPDRIPGNPAAVSSRTHRGKGGVFSEVEAGHPRSRRRALFRPGWGHAGRFPGGQGDGKIDGNGFGCGCRPIFRFRAFLFYREGCRSLSPVRGSMAGHGRAQGDWKDFESSHDRWLHSLRAGDGAMVGSPAELAELAGQIQEWQRPLATSAASPFRLCFRLEEPDGNGDQKEKAGLRMASWYVRYLLQAARDPSLLIPAEEAWKAKGGAGKKGRSASPLLQDGFDHGSIFSCPSARPRGSARGSRPAWQGRRRQVMNWMPREPMTFSPKKLWL